MTTLVLAVLYAALGWATGMLHFILLRRNVRMFVERGVCVGAIAFQIARIVAVAALFFLLARSGGAYVLASLAGFLVARELSTRRRRTEET